MFPISKISHDSLVSVVATYLGRIIRDEGGSILKIVEEKDATPSQKAIKEINAGIYCFDWKKFRASFGELKSNNSQGEYYLTDIVEIMAGSYKVDAFITKNDYHIMGINDMEAKEKVEKLYLLDNNK